MKRLLVGAAVGALALGLTPALAGAGIDDTDVGFVTIVHDATYDFPDAPFVVTVCIDDEIVDNTFEVTDIIGPLPIPAGEYSAEIFGGTVEDCSGEPAIGPVPLTVEAGDDFTVAAIWTSETEGPGVTIWDNDSSCADEGTARVTVRHGAYTDGPVDVVGVVGGEETALVEGLDEGAQATLDGLPGGLTVEDVQVVAAGTDTTLIVVGDVTLEAGTHYVIYAAGGADGSAGVWVDPIPLDICETPVTPTTPTTAAPTTTAAASPAVATPRFTG
jgi:hypothetical protein